MKLTLTALALSAALVGGMATGAMAEGSVQEAREAVMKSFGGAMKTLGGMAGGEVAFDAAAAETAKATLVAGAAEVAAKWATQIDDPKSASKPEIWTNWDDFLAKDKALADAAAALDVASLDGIKAGMGAIGAACKDCHTAYRVAK